MLDVAHSHVHVLIFL